ncbi:hypothetical protein [Xanthomonas arboricola]|uniref:hypothetical protein n=1 Tax=Xanthomonas arboricola TaxID=56448 RepID=UPI001835166F
MIQHVIDVSGGKDGTATYRKEIESGAPFRTVFALQHDLAGMGPNITAKDEPAYVAKQLRRARRQLIDRVDEIDLGAMGVVA